VKARPEQHLARKIVTALGNDSGRTRASTALQFSRVWLGRLRLAQRIEEYR
jgi:hypothetical protein